MDENSHAYGHTVEAFSSVSHVLPDSIVTVHEYGFRDGRGTQWLASQFSSVVGYDVTMEFASGITGVDLQIGNVCGPQADADLIYVGHILEGRPFEKQFPDRLAVVENLRKHCRYLLLQVHRSGSDIYEWQDKLAPNALLHVTYQCVAGKQDSVTLLKGYLSHES